MRTTATQPRARTRNMQRLVALLWGGAAFFGALADAAAQTPKTVWDGVFTAEQAARGKTIFATKCATCHGPDLGGVNRPPLKGEVFLNRWMEGGLNDLFGHVKSMPPNAANLEGVAYVDLLAFLLDANGFPAGPGELNAEAIPNIQVQGKNGPGPVPNFALVEVVGCFARGPGNAWILTNGSEPARTRNPAKPTASEVSAASAKPLAAQTFRLLDVEYFSNAFRPEAHAGHKVNARGFLIRTETDVRINVTWVEMLSTDCAR
jgi:S-disulfanyl-L-cysteine oxidoreductase SoxD